MDFRGFSTDTRFSWQNHYLRFKKDSRRDMQIGKVISKHAAGKKKIKKDISPIIMREIS